MSQPKGGGNTDNITAAELKGILRPRPAWQAVRREPKILKRLLPFLLSLAFLFAALGGMIVLLSPSVTLRFWGAASTGEAARDLLTGYLRWYQALVVLCAAGFFGNLLLSLFQLWWGVRDWLTCHRLRKPVKEVYLTRLLLWERAGYVDPPPLFTREEAEFCESRVLQAEPYNASASLSIVGTVLSLLVALMFGVMFLSEDVGVLPGRVRADLAQLEAGTLETAEVFISPKCRAARLPGPYGTGQPELTMRYGIIGPDTGSQWVRVYVPHALNFSLEGTRLYDENKSVQWNFENAQRYLVRWTSEFHVAVDVIPIS